MINEDKLLFDKLHELMYSENEEKFLSFLFEHKDLLKREPALYIKYHVSFYMNLEQYDKAEKVINNYKELPYISMEIEDLYKELLDEINHIRSISSAKNYDELQLKKMLFSSKEESIVVALRNLAKQNIRMHLELIKEFLISDANYKFKTLAIFILQEQGVNLDIKVLKNGKIFTYNPVKLKSPFEDERYIICYNQIVELTQKEPSLSKLAIEFLNTIQIKEFPSTLLDLYDPILFAEILVDITYTSIDRETNAIQIKDKYNLSDEDFDQMLIEISKVLML